MGNTPSTNIDAENDDIWWTNGETSNQTQMEASENTQEQFITFANNFEKNRENRRVILQEKRKEIQGIRDELTSLKNENSELRKMLQTKENDTANTILSENEKLRLENANLKQIIEELNKESNIEEIREKNKELRLDLTKMGNEVQKLNSEILEFEKEKLQYQNHVIALKDVIQITKDMLILREQQLKQLDQKMKHLETALSEKETTIMSKDLKEEYERQLTSIRNLKTLYEQRHIAYRREKAELNSIIADNKREISKNESKIKELEERVLELETDKSEKYDVIKTLESDLGLSKAEARQYKAEMLFINQLFSEILLGVNSTEVDWDKLIKTLEEHHDLLQKIAENEGLNEVSFAMPKVLIDLINQINDNNDDFVPKMESTSEETGISTPPLNVNSSEQIVENLPKVWKVMRELLSQRARTPVETGVPKTVQQTCYKTVHTPNGPSSVISVSKTFMRLKNLIMEKKSLEKYMILLRQLNAHLETNFQDQEKRLETISGELAKTWKVFEKVQKEHQLLHTQKKLIGYELSQKRKILKELRENLEYSREKWRQAREKNSKAEKQCKELRLEFSSRKNSSLTDVINSAESGYSDERESLSDDNKGYETDISEKIEDKEILSDKETDAKNSNETVYEIIKEAQDEIEKQMPSQTDAVSLEKNNTNIEISKESISIPSTSKVLEDTPLKTVDSLTSNTTPTKEEFEERLNAREERLQRLENETKELVTKVTKTSNKSLDIANQLDDLHEIYGENSSALEEDTNVNSEENTNPQDANDSQP